MTPEQLHTWLLIITILIGLVGQVAIAGWLLRGFTAGLEASIVARTQAVKDETRLMLDAAIKERDNVITGVQRETGELGHALRTKIHEVELHMRDNFPSNKTFDRSIELLRDQMAAFTTNLAALSERIDAKFEAFDTKLDRL